MMEAILILMLLALALGIATGSHVHFPKMPPRRHH